MPYGITQPSVPPGVTCHPTEVRILPLPQLKQVLDLATLEGRKAELTYVTSQLT